MKKRIIILTCVLLLLLLGGFSWFKEATSPVAPQSTQSKIFVIQRGESVRSVASRLKKDGFIRDPLAFFLLIKKQGVEKDIQAGDFRLSPSMDAAGIVQELLHGTLDVWVTIPEGWRTEEIALELAQKLAIPEQEFLRYAEEGYMFPDTYLFPKEVTASQAAELMRENFDKRAKVVYETSPQKTELTLPQVVNMASLVEREAKFDHDRPLIASVLFNRQRIGMPLQVDATVQYALGYQEEEKTWWKKNLTVEDIEFDSPYNTYKHAGLPPYPIANPGISALQSVIAPEETDYLYYLADESGATHYAKTLEEHNANKEKYL